MKYRFILWLKCKGFFFFFDKHHIHIVTVELRLISNSGWMKVSWPKGNTF